MMAQAHKSMIATSDSAYMLSLSAFIDILDDIYDGTYESANLGSE